MNLNISPKFPIKIKPGYICKKILANDLIIIEEIAVIISYSDNNINIIL